MPGGAGRGDALGYPILSLCGKGSDDGFELFDFELSTDSKCRCTGFIDLTNRLVLSFGVCLCALRFDFPCEREFLFDEREFVCRGTDFKANLVQSVDRLEQPIDFTSTL